MPERLAASLREAQTRKTDDTAVSSQQMKSVMRSPAKTAAIAPPA
jgi:hypothetical protein